MVYAVTKALAVRGRPAVLPAVVTALRKKPAPVTAPANGVATAVVNVIPAALTIRSLARVDTAVADISTLGMVVIMSVTMCIAVVVVPLVPVPAVKPKRNLRESALLIECALATDAIGVLGQRNATARATIPKIVLPVIMETDIPIRGITAPAYATMY